jgi:hypothetical protein
MEPSIINEIDFWSGNRSKIRQKYERKVLDAVLSITIEEYGNYQIKETTTEYPGRQESAVFSDKNHHLFVTVAGNQKFKPNDMIVIATPIANNLLGYRIPIVKTTNKLELLQAHQSGTIKHLKHGIPETWSDATIFRHNNYKVAEEGNFDDVFKRLNAGRFDYTTFGVNEVISVFKNKAAFFNTLTIEPSIMFFYPFPLVFYVHPDMPYLANRIDKGLNKLIDTGQLDKIFNHYYVHVVEDLQLHDREIIILENPLIPKEFATIQPTLLEK